MTARLMPRLETSGNLCLIPIISHEDEPCEDAYEAAADASDNDMDDDVLEEHV